MAQETPRIPPLTPSTLSPTQRELYATITGGPRADGPQHFALTRQDGSLTGPFNALLLAPELGQAVQALGAAVRYETTLSARERETAILVVAAHWGSGFEQSAHEGAAIAAGLTAEEVSVIRGGGLPDFADARERACASLAFAMARGDVDDEQWTAATETLPLETAFELSTLVGYYALLALQLRVFRVDAVVE